MDVTIPCPCPGTPHEADTVTLRDTLGFVEATAIRRAIAGTGVDGEPMVAEERLAVATEGYILYGVASWTLVDDEGEPVPVSRTAIAERLLAHDDAAYEVGEAADGLYARKVLLPLLKRASASSRPTPTDTSTSPTTGSEPTPLMPSSPSSTSTSQTDATATTSKRRAGGSSSSRSSSSAA